MPTDAERAAFRQETATLRLLREDPHGPDTPRVLLVGNEADSAEMVALLARLDRPGSGRAVVRPTPGAPSSGSQVTIGLDLLAALGKNPELLHRAPGIRQQSLPLATAWIQGLPVRELVIDRAHNLAVELVVALTALVEHGARLWLMWSCRERPDGLLAALAAAGRPATRIGWYDVAEILLPTAPALPPARPGLWADKHAAARAAAAGEQPWPVLPAADFTTFRAACQRLLSRRDHARVDALYRTAAEQVDDWIDAHRQPSDIDRLGALLPPPLERIAGPLGAWLRDTYLGPEPAPVALIKLRAAQAALFSHGILLRWNVTALGPDPAGRLPGTLTAAAAANLTALPRVDHAALTALSLHLNQGTLYFSCWRLGHLAADGSTLAAPGPHHHELPNWMRSIGYAAAAGAEDVPCAQPVTIPAHARPIFAAHRAYRRIQGSGDRALLFSYMSASTRPGNKLMREIVARTCRRLNLDPPWLHREHCRNGTDIGLRIRMPGWLAERGLTLHALDRDLVAHLAHRHTPWRYPRRHQPE